ncbi:ATP-binding protein [Candidatus Uhrbacteria bacterium]|nr:ATP-binding protein [Candidatus Uhrbacteria bacterium]
MYIKRTLEKKLKELVNSFPIVALTGPRQSGKTTLAQHAFPDWRYVSLEDLDTRTFAENDPRGFFATHESKVIIDEAQRVPALFSYLQSVVDKNKKPGQFILTGSQNFLMHEKIGQSLAGRVALLHLLPFEICELAEAGITVDRYREYIFKGFYPSLYRTSVSPRDWYLNYVQTYIERDVRLIKNITDLNAFQTFTQLCAGRIGQLLNLSSLAHDCGISHNTARAWLSVLEDSFIVFLIKPHHKNFNKRLVKMPKLYFYDAGLAAALLGIHASAQIDLHPSKGNLFEALTMSELMKYQYHRGLPPRCFFWRDKTGHEIDCLLDIKNMLIPIEIKSGETISEHYFAELQYWNTLAGADPKKSFLVYGGAENQTRNGINVVRWDATAEIFKSFE